MAGSVNKAIIVGRLGGDPELRYTPSGQAVANFNVATNERMQRDGQWDERTEWHRIVVWGKLAERCDQYLNKGHQVYIEGRLQTRSWEDRDGNKRYTTEIVAATVQFLTTPSSNRSENTGEGRPAAKTSSDSDSSSSDSSSSNFPASDEDDFPF